MTIRVALEHRVPDGAAHEGWPELAALLDRSSPAALAADTRRLLADEGVTYRPPGEDEQPWALDPLPLPLSAATWAELEAGVAQRALLLDQLLADLYGPRRTLRTGLLPVEVVLGHPGYVHGWARATPRPRELFLAGADLVRTPEGWRVLGDRVQAPSGAGYALANRRIVARVLAAVRRDAQIRRLGPFFDAMRRGLEELAAGDRARVVLLTPGPRSETAYEQALLASRLGFPLVLASELTVREGRVWQRTMGGSHDGSGRLEPVDVILRRVDAAWCDPLDLRQDSRLGVPGLLEAARLGTVTVVNGLGSGVAENPGLLPFLPAVAEALLDEPLALADAATWWCGDPVGRSHVLTHLADLLVKPIARGEGRGTVDAATLTAAQRTELAARIEAEPHAWIGQEPQRLSTAPVVAADGSLDARPLVLRTFAVAVGGAFRVLAGGLAEAGVRGATVAKDVWVSGATVAAPVGTPAAGAEAALSPRVAADLFWLGRYAERAEGTARLLRAVADRFADLRSTPEPAGGEALDVLLRAATAVTTTPESTPVHTLITDRDLPGSLAYAVHRLTGAAQAVREQLSTDTWLVLGRLESVLGEVTATGDLSGALSRVLEGLLALAGLAHESHVRDAGWHLTDAGKRVERAQHVAGLIAATLCAPGLPAADALVRESVLIAAESLITARRRRRTGLDAVLELLITDPENPRSIGYQADQLRQDVAHIPGPDDGVLDALVAVERRLAGLRPADLARIGPDGSRDRLRNTLVGLGRDLTRFADVLEGARFAPVAPLRPLGPGGGG